MNPSSLPGGKAKYAWSDIDRAEPPKRPATDRVSDFRQTHLPYDEATARAQASRCGTSLPLRPLSSLRLYASM